MEVQASTQQCCISLFKEAKITIFTFQLHRTTWVHLQDAERLVDQATLIHIFSLQLYFVRKTPPLGSRSSHGVITRLLMSNSIVS